ncbi:MAG: hypothetical protein HQL94_03750 [Magnetococcales bacterium]|nr:hypothetical protein [Magnetococcales bacterium]MBF0439003.1 hypothetical protein [Magnetococcales bacterium]
MTQEQAWYLKKSVVWTLILAVGPLALPLVWLSPHFSRTYKTVLTLLLLLLTAFMIYGGLMMRDKLALYGIDLDAH